MFLQIGLSIALARIFILVEDELKNGAKKVFIHTVDTYVVGIAISHYKLRLIQAGFQLY